MTEGSPSRPATEPEIAPDSLPANGAEIAPAVTKDHTEAGKSQEKPKDEENLTTSRGGDDRSRSRRRRSRSKSRSRSRDRRRRKSRSRSKSRDRRHRRYSRSRSRSRSRDRRRRHRSRSRSRDRHHRRHRRRRSSSSDDDRRRPYGSRAHMMNVEDPYAKLRKAAGQVAVDPAQIARQMQEQQLRARQVVLQQQANSALTAASKPQREVYVGNLPPGVVTATMLHQLFSSTLKALLPDKCQDRDPVINVNMAGEGKYAFVETISSELATACLQLNGQMPPIEGNTLSIGRPVGYIDPAKAHAAAHAAAEALDKFQKENNASGAVVTNGSTGAHGGEAQGEGVSDGKSVSTLTPFLAAEGVISMDGLKNDAEYQEVLGELYEEFGRYGNVLSIHMPRPENKRNEGEGEEEEGQGVQDGDGSGDCGKAFIQYVDAESAKAAVAAIDGRMFAGQRIEVKCVSATAFLEATGQKI